MFWILGADYFMNALGQMSGHPFFKGLAWQLDHAEWEGFHFYDLIFPLFVFIVGVSLVFSLTRIIEREGKAAACWRIWRRFALLYLLGIFYYGGFANPWPGIRLVGVLNRIAVCYLAAGLVFCFFRWRGILAVCVTLLAGYWALMSFTPFPDVRPRTPAGELISPVLTATNTAQLDFSGRRQLRGELQPGLNLANYLDQKYLPGMKWDKTWDPEGLLSTVPAMVTCLLGVLAGLLLNHPSLTGQRKVIWLLGGGVLGVAAGWLWSLDFPVIKKIWTSSYVLVAGGYSALLLGAFYQVIEIWQVRRWTPLFVWIGMNPITLYLADNVLGFDRIAKRLCGGGLKAWLDGAVMPGFGELVLAGVALGCAVLLARALYLRKIFLRL
jgi:predicted acyltransferase